MRRVFSVLLGGMLLASGLSAAIAQSQSFTPRDETPEEFPAA